MDPLRSLLFVPGHREDWVDKAIASGADALIFDLEDSVPLALKPEARLAVRRSIERIAGQQTGTSVYVRVNPLGTHLTGDDIEAVAVEGLAGLSLPMLHGPHDVVRYDALVEHFEHRAGLQSGTIEFICNLETAEAFASCEQFAAASPRVATLFAGTARDADVSRSIGFQFTPEGLETLYLRSRAILAARASGLTWPLVGLWQDLDDPEGAERFARQNRQLGFRGQVLIHPSHVAFVNETYGPSADEVQFYSGMIEAFAEAEARGSAAVAYRGMHVDYAHVKTAHEVLRLATQLGMDGSSPD